MKIKKIFMSLTLILTLGLSTLVGSSPVKGAGDYVTVKNNSGAMVKEGELIKFDGVSAFNQTIPVKLYYMIYDPNGNLVSSYNFMKQYTSDTREIYYSYQFPVSRTTFTKRGLYKVKVMFEKVSGTPRLIDSKEFEVFIDITEKPLEPKMTLSPLPPSTATTVTVALAQGTGENSALLPLTFQYRTTIYENWKPYNATTKIPVTTNGTYVYARACTSSGECSKVSTVQVNNVNEPIPTPPTTKTPSSVYTEESRIATYYFIGFDKDDSGATPVPLPTGTTPTP
jgi:hypothetical protein